MLDGTRIKRIGHGFNKVIRVQSVKSVFHLFYFLATFLQPSASYLQIPIPKTIHKTFW